MAGNYRLPETSYRIYGMTQTAVEFMFNELYENSLLVLNDQPDRDQIEEIQTESKHLHRAQVEQAWIDGMKSTAIAPFDDEFYRTEAAKYYDDTYGK